MSKSTRRPGHWYPWIFVGMFAVVVAVNSLLAYFATSTFNGLATEGAYEKGLAYNQALAGAAAQEKLGWSVEAELAPAGGEHGGTVNVAVTDRDGAPLDGLDVTAVFRRPTQAGHDQTVRFTAAGAGRYVGTVVLPFPGQWEMLLVANRGDDSYQSDRRIMVP